MDIKAFLGFQEPQIYSKEQTTYLLRELVAATQALADRLEAIDGKELRREACAEGFRIIAVTKSSAEPKISS